MDRIPIVKRVISPGLWEFCCVGEKKKKLNRAVASGWGEMESGLERCSGVGLLIQKRYIPSVLRNLSCQRHIQ